MRHPLPRGVNGPNAIAQAPGGAMWFVTSGNRLEPSAVGWMTSAGTTKIYLGGKHAGLQDDAIGFFGIAFDAGGNGWFAEPLNGKIARITPGGVVTEVGAAGALPFKLTPGPLNSMWYTLNGSSAIGRVTTAGAPIATAYPVPSPRPQATANVQAVVAGTDGNLYFTDCGASGKGIDAIGQLVVAGHPRVQEIAVPTQHSCPQGIVALADGSVWFMESNAAAKIYNIARLRPQTPFARSTIDEFAMPVAPGKLAFLTTVADGSIWTADNGPDPGSITHVTGFSAAAPHVPPHFSVMKVSQQPVPIAQGPGSSVWFGSPAVHALDEYRP